MKVNNKIIKIKNLIYKKKRRLWKWIIYKTKWQNYENKQEKDLWKWLSYENKWHTVYKKKLQNYEIRWFENDRIMIINYVI